MAALLWCNLSFAGVVTGYKFGKGPLKVSQNVADILEYFFSGGKMGKYAKKQKEPWKPGLIVIAYDGSEYSYYRHPLSISQIDNQHYVGLARQRCKKRSGKECFLFANGYKIVWDNGSDKKKRRLKKKDIMAGKTLQILQELGFYDGGITQTKKIEKKKEIKKTEDILPTNTIAKSVFKDKSFEDLVYLNYKKRNKKVKEHWNKKYPNETKYKAWAEGDNQEWAWRSSNLSEENAVKKALERCNEHRIKYDHPPNCVVTKVGDKHLTYQEQADWIKKISGRTTLAAKLISKKKIEKKKKPKKKKENEDIVKKLKDLQELYDSGALTKEEYTKAKAKLLN